MSHSFDIHFEPAHVDTVTFAIAPFDAFTGQIVSEGVEASVNGIPIRPIRNRSGLLVFINLPAQPQYQFSVRAAAAGYFDPPPQTFTPPGANDPDWAEKRRKNLALTPLPSSHFPEATTLVRGVVVRGADAVAGATVKLEPLEGGSEFETRTADRGAFALPLRLPPLLPGEDEAPVPITLHVKEAGDERVLTRQVSAGTSYRFADPINLADLEQPDLVEI
jgi:hypothetical protein